MHYQRAYRPAERGWIDLAPCHDEVRFQLWIRLQSQVRGRHGCHARRLLSSMQLMTPPPLEVDPWVDQWWHNRTKETTVKATATKATATKATATKATENSPPLLWLVRAHQSSEISGSAQAAAQLVEQLGEGTQVEALPLARIRVLLGELLTLREQYDRVHQDVELAHGRIAGLQLLALIDHHSGPDFRHTQHGGLLTAIVTAVARGDVAVGEMYHVACGRRGSVDAMEG